MRRNWTNRLKPKRFDFPHWKSNIKLQQTNLYNYVVLGRDPMSFFPSVRLFIVRPTLWTIVDHSIPPVSNDFPKFELHCERKRKVFRLFQRKVLHRKGGSLAGQPTTSATFSNYWWSVCTHRVATGADNKNYTPTSPRATPGFLVRHISISYVVAALILFFESLSSVSSSSELKRWQMGKLTAVRIFDQQRPRNPPARKY